MVRILVLSLVLGPLAAAAQPVPDTVSADRYFPMEVGDVWEYERVGFIEGFERRSIPGDSIIAGDRYFRYRVDYFAPDGTPTDPPLESLLRVDPTTRSIRTVSGDPNELGALFLTTCPLDSDYFDELFDCPGSAVVLTSGGPETVFIGDDSLQTSLKFFDDNSREVVGAYAADIGFTGFTMRTGQLTLVYASVGGTTYGTQIPVSHAPAPDPATRLEIDLRPNPTAGPLIVRASLPATGPVVVEVWDALGRRVYRTSSVRAAGAFTLEIASAEWEPGAYLVRVTAAGASAVTRVIRR